MSKNPWNVVEQRETRINSQVALEGVIALPDDAQITMEDRIEIAHRAAHHFFVRHGLAVQVDIHEPHDTEDHNWHAHFLATTRTFTESGNVYERKSNASYVLQIGHRGRADSLGCCRIIPKERRSLTGIS